MSIKEGSSVSFKFVTAARMPQTIVIEGSVVKMREHTATLAVLARSVPHQRTFSLPFVWGGQDLTFINVSHDRLSETKPEIGLYPETLLRMQNILQNFRVA